MSEREFTPASFYQFLGEKKLMASKCQRCGAIYLPPHPLCTKCYGNKMEWVQLKGKGKLAAFTVIAVGPTFMCEEGFDRNKPYCTGVVELEEGVRISARILLPDLQHPERVKVGIPLSVEFLPKKEGGTALAFKP